MRVPPPEKPQEAKPDSSPEFPINPSVKTAAPFTQFSLTNEPVAVVGLNPRIKSGVSVVQVGVNGLVPSSFEADIETTGETTLTEGVPCTVISEYPVPLFSSLAVGS